MKIDQLFDKALLDEMIRDGLVSARPHPTERLTIFNYTKKCQYDRVWNDVTSQCRGLIVAEDGTVVSRPWRKFFNYGEHDVGDWDPDDTCFVTDKMDGSLGVLYPLSAGGYAVATRGSFTSDQAIYATAMWNERYADWTPAAGMTYLFEIIYPANRVVVDYGDLEELVLLGAVVNETGRTIEAAMTGWPYTRVANFGFMTLREALEMEPREKVEGVVLHFGDRNQHVKLKQDDYIALHRIITGLNEKHVWERLAVDACASHIHDPQHWGSFLKIDPADALQYIETGPAWVESIPEEFQEWLNTTMDEIKERMAETLSTALDLAEECRDIAERKDQFLHVKDHPCATEIMRYVNGDRPAFEIVMKAWKVAKPEFSVAVFDREEDVA